MLHPEPHQLTPDEPIVRFRRATCGYESQPVVRDVTFDILPADFVGLLGPSGSGKTTLLRAILGAARLFDGEILLDGVPVGPRGIRAGYVPQLEAIDWYFPVTVEQVILMGRTASAPLFPWYRRRDREEAREVLARLGIAGLAARHIRELSGGQQQRVFLARALLSNPRLLLLDEPTAGVDVKTRDDILHLLDDLNHQGVTIVIATHEINAVAAHLPWVVCLNGQVVAEGPPGEVFTPEILRRTYNAEMPVTRYEGMTLVAERPHFLGRTGARAAGRSPGSPSSPADPHRAPAPVPAPDPAGTSRRTFEDGER